MTKEEKLIECAFKAAEVLNLAAEAFRRFDERITKLEEQASAIDHNFTTTKDAIGLITKALQQVNQRIAELRLKLEGK